MTLRLLRDAPLNFGGVPCPLLCVRVFHSMQRVSSNAFHRRASQKAFDRSVFGFAVALTGVASGCVWLLCATPFAPSYPVMAARPPVPVAQPAAQAARSAPQTVQASLAPATAAPATFDLASGDTRAVDLDRGRALVAPTDLLDPTYTSGIASSSFAKGGSAPLNDRFVAPAAIQAATPIAQDIPKPAAPVARRPVQTASLAPVRPAEVRPAQGAVSAIEQKAPKNKILSNAAVLKIFEKALGKPPQEEPIALAYAAPDGGVQTDSRTLTQGLSLYDSATAVYDVSNATVHMPDGTKLEAHSGVGPARDDPRHAHVRMRGVTPPHVYDLKLRESLFHGVRAIRMNPIGGEAAIFGRSGILAHSYLLGPRGDSHGCVSFKNYDAFLQAFLKGEVKRMVVVARLD
jgi:type VI secretion system (T6SS) effector TldE1-like protein